MSRVYTTSEVLPMIWSGGAHAECRETGDILQREGDRVVYGPANVVMSADFMRKYWRIVGGAYVRRAGGRCPRCGSDVRVETDMCEVCAMPLGEKELQVN